MKTKALKKITGTLFFLFIGLVTFSQDKQDIIDILSLLAEDYESEVFFNNDSPFGRALFIKTNPLLGYRRSLVDPMLVAFNDLTEDDLRGFARPILIYQYNEEDLKEFEPDVLASNTPKFTNIFISNYKGGIYLTLNGATYQESDSSHNGQYRFTKNEESWEMISKEINKRYY